MPPLSDFPQRIKTERLTLSVLKPSTENAEKIFGIIEQNRDYLTAWQGHFGKLTNTDDVVAYLTKREKQISENQGVCFYIFHNDNLIGRIRFFNIQDTTCEIGYWLAQSVNHNGFMSEALSALESELFKFGFNKITLDIDDGNIPSETLAKRNGYKLARRLPLASYAKCVGKCDSLIYEKANKEN